MGDTQINLSGGRAGGGATYIPQEGSKNSDESPAHSPTHHEISTLDLARTALNFRDKFKRSGAVADISDAITAMQTVVDRTPETTANLPAMLALLAAFLGERYESTGSLPDIKDAISNQKRALLLTPTAHPCFLGHFFILERSFIPLIQRTGELSALDDIISAQSLVPPLIPEGDADLPNVLNSLGMSFRLRFFHTGDVRDINDAISAFRKGINVAPESHRMLPTLLGNLGISITSLWVSTRNLCDLDEAISLYRAATNLTGQGDSALPVLLSNLCFLLWQRFQESNDLSDLNWGVSVGRKAVELLPDGHTLLPGTLSHLGDLFSRRFLRLGNLSDITEAVSVRHRIVNLTPDGDALLPTHLCNLGSALVCRFRETGEFSDFTGAISLLTQAVELSPNIPWQLATLADALWRRFRHTGVQTDIDEAISLYKRAVDLTEVAKGKARRLSHLGRALVCRFERGGDLPDLTEAIEVQTLGVTLSHGNFIDHPHCLANLGLSLVVRFKRIGDLRDLEEAQSKQRTAIELTMKHGGTSLANLYFELAQTEIEYYRETGILEHLSTSLAALSSCATDLSASPRTRVAAARQWAKLLGSDHPIPVEAITAFEIIIPLLAFIVGPEQTVKRRYASLEEHPRIPLTAAATALQLEMPTKALEWLEQGRCLVWGQQNHLHTPLDELQSHDAALADKFMDVSKRLEIAGSSVRTSQIDIPISMRHSLSDEVGKHVRLAAEWGELVTIIRSIAGFESFLQPAPFSSLVQHLPASGHVIIINVHKIRCDAIALVAGSDGPLPIPLPDFSLDKAKKYRNDLDTYIHAHGIRMRGNFGGNRHHRDDDNRETIDDADLQGEGELTRAIGVYRAKGSVRRVLRSLWTEVVKPILNGLNISKGDGSSGEGLPRLWWCPTGPLSFLPIHAAGNYSAIDSECLFDYAVPSYTPTLSALSHRVRYDRQIDPATSGLLLTSQPAPRGAANIPGTTMEVRTVYSKAAEEGFRVEKLEGDAVTPEEYLTHMEDFSCVHLACHGTQDPADPRQSRFLFHKGELTLNEIAQRNLKNADLAFLSACKTSAGKETLPDEAVHLAAGMLAAGYRRVVATMWAIGDEHAPQVADDFYQYLWTHREEGSEAHFDGSQSARALHHAIQLLRGRTGTSDASLLAWIPYVHFGY